MNPESSEEKFAISRAGIAAVSDRSSEVYFDIECTHFHNEQKILIGLVDSAKLTDDYLSQGLGVAINPKTGEIRDLINGQGIIGYLEEAPLEPYKAVRMAVEIEKIGNVYIPRIIVGDETILHPALYIGTLQSMAALVGTTTQPDAGACFDKPNVGVNVREDF